jgi:predicted hotdog family 3-hydroxylacyl-ACP dehydratase
MLTHADIATLIPHRGSMCLLDRVLDWNHEKIRCIVANHRSPQHPLRGASGLLSVCGVEFAAQAIAVHNALLAAPDHDTPKVGYLANAKDVAWVVDRLDDITGDLLIEAEQLISEGGRSIYQFTISAESRTLLEGRVAVALEGSTR